MQELPVSGEMRDMEGVMRIQVRLKELDLKKRFQRVVHSDDIVFDVTRIVPVRFDSYQEVMCRCLHHWTAHFAGVAQCKMPKCQCRKHREVTSGNRNQA